MCDTNTVSLNLLTTANVSQLYVILRYRTLEFKAAWRRAVFSALLKTPTLSYKLVNLPVPIL